MCSSYGTLPNSQHSDPVLSDCCPYDTFFSNPTVVSFLIVLVVDTPGNYDERSCGPESQIQVQCQERKGSRHEGGTSILCIDPLHNWWLFTATMSNRIVYEDLYTKHGFDQKDVLFIQARMRRIQL